MPAQTSSSNAAFYGENDTYPPLRRRLLDGDGNPVDLTGATVTIDIAYSSYDFYYSPMQRIVENSSVTVETPQSTPSVTGWVNWTPGTGDLSPPGSHDYRFKVVHAGGGIQHFPPLGYEKLVVTSGVGGPP